MTSTQKLSFPYRSYNFGNLVTFFNKSEIYNSEIKRCCQFLDSYTFEEPTYVLLNIGSIIDNLDWPYRKPTLESYIYLPIFVRMTNLPIVIIGISPIFSEDPEFINAERLLGNHWIKKGKLHYEFINESGVKWTYYHFNTLFPEFIEQDFYSINGKKAYWKGTNKRISLFHKKHIDKYPLQIQELADKITIRIIRSDTQFSPYYNDIVKNSSSDNDELFVERFLEILFSMIARLPSSGSKLTVLNFAVFANVHDRRPSWYFMSTFYKRYFRLNLSDSIFLNFSFKDVVRSKFRFEIDYGNKIELLKQNNIKYLRFVNVNEIVSEDNIIIGTPTQKYEITILNLPALQQQKLIKIKVGRFGETDREQIQVYPSDSITTLKQKIKNSGVDIGKKDLYLKGHNLFHRYYSYPENDIPMTEDQKTLALYDIKEGDTILY